VVLGTRPEAIKLAPVIHALRKQSSLALSVVSTGQHREMLDQVFKVFGIEVNHELNVMEPNQSLPDLTSRVLTAVDRVLAVEQPHAVIVQGDTTTAFAASLAAFYRKVPVGHVEAGLRTNDRYAPFPEEINRRLVSALTQWHFAPTRTSYGALQAEGIDQRSIYLTGNPVIDALYHVLSTTSWPDDISPPERRLVLVTAHRRESFGASFEAICRAIRRTADLHEDIEVWYPVHRNPNVREPVMRLLSGHDRIRLTDPLDYTAFSHVLSRAHVVLTDSGGLQEEAPALGKPVLVMRDVTERPEAVDAGVVELVGTDEDRIVRRLSSLLTDDTLYTAMSRAQSPYGDGLAGARIAAILAAELGAGTQASANEFRERCSTA
jgi:UDP-N-acetylglucosamine 2-epimerase (non-hydrolysing)